MLDILAAEPVYQKVCDQTGQKLPFMFLDRVAEIGLRENVISEKEADLLRVAEEGRLETINVDDFDPAELAAASRALDKVVHAA